MSAPPELGDAVAVSPDAEQRYAALVLAAGRTCVGLDFDGTLSPIVDDPALAHIHPEAAQVLIALGEVVGSLAIITGRPARQAVSLGDLDTIGRAFAERGKVLHVFGQYGHEHWSSVDRRVITPRPPLGLSSFLADLPATLRRLGETEVYVEEKGLGVGLHTRRLPDPAAAWQRLLEPITALAAKHGLVLEPGRHVLEVRAPGVDKGQTVRAFAADNDAGGFLFAGDDLGDLEAYRAVEELRRDGLPALLVHSASTEQSVLRDRADFSVPGPEGVLDLLRRFTTDARRS